MVSTKKIGEVAKEFGVSAHTLRYYEKIKLLPPIPKDNGGQRIYSDSIIRRIQFIKRAQRMHFSLDEIRSLIDLEAATIAEKPHAQKIVKEKLVQIEESLNDLVHLKRDLSGMLEACLASSDDGDCPIIAGIKDPVK